MKTLQSELFIQVFLITQLPTPSTLHLFLLNNHPLVEPGNTEAVSNSVTTTKYLTGSMSPYPMRINSPYNNKKKPICLHRSTGDDSHLGLELNNKWILMSGACHPITNTRLSLTNQKQQPLIHWINSLRYSSIIKVYSHGWNLAPFEATPEIHYCAQRVSLRRNTRQQWSLIMNEMVVKSTTLRAGRYVWWSTNMVTFDSMSLRCR